MLASSDLSIHLIIKEKIITQTLTEFLTELKYKVSTFDSISELVKNFTKKQEIKELVIIEDVTFRGEEKAIIRRIHDQYSDVLFVVITSNIPDISTKEAISYGIYGYLHRPISLAELELLLVRLYEKINN